MFGVESFGETEVDDLGRAIGSDEDVGWFEVAVDHALVVRVGDSFADSEEKIDDFGQSLTTDRSDPDLPPEAQQAGLRGSR